MHEIILNHHVSLRTFHLYFFTKLLSIVFQTPNTPPPPSPAVASMQLWLIIFALAPFVEANQMLVVRGTSSAASLLSLLAISHEFIDR